MTVLTWTANQSPPEPAGIFAPAAIARRLLQKLQTLTTGELGRYSVVASRDFIVLLGPPGHLPWLDGLQYCAPHPQARDLWLPTHTSTSMSADLVQAALARRLGAQPLLLLNQPEQIIPLSDATALNHAALLWLLQELA